MPFYKVLIQIIDSKAEGETNILFIMFIPCAEC